VTRPKYLRNHCAARLAATRGLSVFTLAPVLTPDTLWVGIDGAISTSFMGAVVRINGAGSVGGLGIWSTVTLATVPIQFLVR
jgi:hypothetical protein